MAITIRNKSTEALVRRLGKRWGIGPSAVIRRLAENAVAQSETGTVSPDEFKRRMKAWDELMAMVPEFTEEEKRQMQYEMDHMYDYLDEEARDHIKAAE